MTKTSPNQHIDLSITDVVTAAARISGALVQTPCMPSKTLSDIAGCEIFIKFENLQFTASFKERGALNKLLSLQGRPNTPGVVAMSAGNHAQGLAYHANRLGIPATIVMPKGTPFTKIARTQAHGATVIVEGDNLAEATARAEQLAEDQNLTFVHPYDDLDVMSGQGTLALEVLTAVPDLDAIVVPVGGGGLIAGISAYLREAAPQCEVVGVQSQTYPSMANFLEGRDGVGRHGLTIAEGIAVTTPGQLTRQIIKSHGLKILSVSEASIEHAIALLLDVEKTVAEGAGASPLAAVLENRSYFAGKKIVLPVTGGNIDLRILAGVAMRALVRQSKILRLSLAISDQPGALASLTSAIASSGGNVIDIGHDRLALGLTAKGAKIEILVEVQDERHGDELMTALQGFGYTSVVKMTDP